jgi:hypothetical protein
MGRRRIVVALLTASWVVKTPIWGRKEIAAPVIGVFFR